MRSSHSFSLKDQRTKNKLDNRTQIGLAGLILGALFSGLLYPSMALAQAEIAPMGRPLSQVDANTQAEAEIPEEILRTEIITEARSPITGKPMTAAEYAQLQAELSDPITDGIISDDLRYLIFLLQIRRTIRPIVPFL